jgi:hypothetical protein
MPGKRVHGQQSEAAHRCLPRRVLFCEASEFVAFRPKRGTTNVFVEMEDRGEAALEQHRGKWVAVE